MFKLSVSPEDAPDKLWKGDVELEFESGNCVAVNGKTSFAPQRHAAR